MWRIIETSTSYRDPERGGVEGGRGDRVREGGREWGGEIQEQVCYFKHYGYPQVTQILNGTASNWRFTFDIPNMSKHAR